MSETQVQPQETSGKLQTQEYTRHAMWLADSGVRILVNRIGIGGVKALADEHGDHVHAVESMPSNLQLPKTAGIASGMTPAEFLGIVKGTRPSTGQILKAVKSIK